MADFEQLKNQLSSVRGQKQKAKKIDDDEDYGDELGDQMNEDLFQEADEMGIFEQLNKDGDEYSKALQKIESELGKQKDKKEVKSTDKS